MNEDRNEKLNQYIIDVVKKLVDTHMTRSKFKSKKAIRHMTDQICSLLKVSLDCEREQYIKDLEKQIQEQELQKNYFESQLEKLKQDTLKKNMFLQDQNKVLAKKSEHLENHMKIIEWKKLNSASDYRTALKQRDIEVNRLQACLYTSREFYRNISIELDQLKAIVNENNSKQLRFIGKVKRALQDETYKSLHMLTRRVRDDTNKDMVINQKKINEQVRSHETILNSVSLLLSTIKSITPDGVDIPQFSIDTFVEDVGKIRTFITECVMKQRDQVKKEIRREISHSLPNFQLGDHESIPEALTKYYTRTQLRDEKSQVEISKLENNIFEMKQKITNANNNIAYSQPIKERTEVYFTSVIQADDFEDLNRNRKIWEKRRKKLDQTLAILSKSTNTNLSRISNDDFKFDELMS